MAAPTISDDWRSILSALPPKWDSYAAKPISRAALDAVGRIAIVPCADGGVQIELHQGGYDVEICFDAAGHIEDVFVDDPTQPAKLD